LATALLLKFSDTEATGPGSPGHELVKGLLKVLLVSVNHLLGDFNVN